jgi:hypothetical protein
MSDSSFQRTGAAQEPTTVDRDHNHQPWIQDFVKACARDPMQVAVDILQAACQECQRSSLEATAHRVLQEIELAKAYSSKKTSSKPDLYEFSSPYQPDFNAELGEPVFDIFQRLVTPKKDGRASRPAQYLWGPKLADLLVQKYRDAQSSGGQAVYRPQNRSKETIIIPKNLLFLCLPSSTMAQANLQQISGFFDLSATLLEALDDWGLKTEFPTLRKHAGSDLPTSKTCLHCLVFVARAYKCMYTLQWTNIRGSSSTKVIRCLQILEDEVEKMQLMIQQPKATPTRTATQQFLPQASPDNKKRARPSTSSPVMLAVPFAVENLNPIDIIPSDLAATMEKNVDMDSSQHDTAEVAIQYTDNLAPIKLSEDMELFPSELDDILCKIAEADFLLPCYEQVEGP